MGNKQDTESISRIKKGIHQSYNTFRSSRISAVYNAQDMTLLATSNRLQFA